MSPPKTSTADATPVSIGVEPAPADVHYGPELEATTVAREVVHNWPDHLRTPEIERAAEVTHAATVALEAARATVREAEIARAQSITARHAHADALVSAERAIFKGGKPAEAAWIQLREAGELVEARVRACDSALADAKLIERAAETRWNLSWETRGRLERDAARAHILKRLAAWEQQRQANEAAWNSIGAEFITYVAPDLGGWPMANGALQAVYSQMLIDTAVRTIPRAVTSITAENEADPETIDAAQRERARRLDVFNDLELAQLRFLFDRLGATELTSALLLQRFAPSEYDMRVLGSTIPFAKWPGHLQDPVKVAEIRAGLPRALGIAAQLGFHFTDTAAKTSTQGWTPPEDRVAFDALGNEFRPARTRL